jgi:hypothetical protein
MEQLCLLRWRVSVFNRLMDQIDTTTFAILALVCLSVLVYLRYISGRQERVQRRLRRALRVALNA